MSLLDELQDEHLDRMKRKRFGLYRGIVRDVDDPENKGRIRAEVHELLGPGKLTDFASYCAPFGGGGAGFFMLPRPGDGVWIMFERGEPSKPVWIGFWFNAEDGVPDGAGKDVRVLRSKSGHQITFGDESGKEFMEVKDKAGNTVRIDSKLGEISIQASGDINVTAGGTVNLDAPQVKTTQKTDLAGGGRRVARIGDLVVSRGHLVQTGRIRTGAAKTSAS